MSTTPRPLEHDVVIVRAKNGYRIHRFLGVGLSNGFRDGDPSRTMPHDDTIAAGTVLAATYRVNLWVMGEDGVVTFVSAHRTAAK